MSEESDLKEINKKIQKKLDEYEQAFKKLTMKDMAESASRTYKMEFDQENPIKPKKKPKKDKKTITPDKGGKGNYEFTVASDKGGKGNYTPEGIRKMPPISREMAKGGEVKKYMGGGSVHKNKKNMITTKGWGASRKT